MCPKAVISKSELPCSKMDQDRMLPEESMTNPSKILSFAGISETLIDLQSQSAEVENRTGMNNDSAQTEPIQQTAVESRPNY